jgi:hypothetical protein
MIPRPPSAKANASVTHEALRAVLTRNPKLRSALEFLLAKPSARLSFRDLRIQPPVPAHRNLIHAEPFFLPKERFGGSRDLPMVPLLRHVVDESLRAYAATRPHFLEYVGKTPISPYGSLALSVARWGYVDWDYIRDLDWRIFLPPEIGHLSGFKSYLEQTLTEELQKCGFYSVLGGKDVEGQSQVQLRDAKTDEIHGFHFFLIAMKPGFVRGNLHRDGGYSPYFAYFPERSLDEHLESANLLWSDLIDQQRRDYIDMFNQLSFNIFGENSTEDRLQKTRGWYLHKAFKWYATLARVRGLAALEEDLMYQYEHFQGSEAELSYLARYRYYARLTPIETRVDDVDRDLARAASIAYAKARNPDDPLIGQKIELDGSEMILLEPAPERFADAARKLLKEAAPKLSKRDSISAPIRFADNLAAPAVANLDGHGQTILIPAEWSMVFCDSYAAHVAKRSAQEKKRIAEKDIRQVLFALLASLLTQASQVRGDATSEAVASVTS